MASRKEISIVIKGNLGSGGNDKEISFSKTASSAISTDKSSQEEISKYGKGGKGGKAAWIALALYSANTAKKNIEAAASAAWNRYVDMNEEYMAQNTMTEVKAHIGAISSYASAAITGANIGKLAGPAGAAVGAVVGMMVVDFSYSVHLATKLKEFKELSDLRFEDF